MMVNNRERALENGTKGASIAYKDSPRGADWQGARDEASFAMEPNISF